ncbi:MAG: acyl-CoA carboxylase subunit epsilon [Frankiaceae bacterium]|nr:acyl-CoA carboxylase subunit epsilon [Frankiaceae bacterium]
MTLNGSDAGGERPLLRVVRGDATTEEIAALVAVLTSRTAASVDTPDPAPSLWSRPVLRTALHPGPGAWRASSLPR